MPRILIIDDNPDIIEALDLLLGLHGYQTICASDPKSAVMAVTHQSIDLVIQDMNFSYSATSGEEGSSLFSHLKQLKPNLPIIIITAWSQLETAVELVKAGAADYLQKPWDDSKLLKTIEQICQQSSAQQTSPNRNESKPANKSNFIFQSDVMKQLVNTAQKVAQSDINVLITGANGSGKEKLADHIHQLSVRHNSPFIKVNMGALPAELMEAELFGAEKGAFTGANERRQGRFEVADGGILFLDEIGNLSLNGQMKLLRVLQTGEFERLGSNVTQKVDVRVISATNADLQQAVKDGTFREDLLYRLNVVELHIPPLAQRKDDILPLAQYFLTDSYQLSDEAQQRLLQHDWPGNVRELENTCQRAKVFCDGNVISVADLGADLTNNASSARSEKDQITDALREHKGVIKHAADSLGMSRQSLYRRLEKYQLNAETFES